MWSKKKLLWGFCFFFLCNVSKNDGDVTISTVSQKDDVCNCILQRQNVATQVIKVGGAMVECPPQKKIPLMKLWDLTVIGLIKMCSKFWQKNYQEVPLLRENLCLKIYIENPMG